MSFSARLRVVEERVGGRYAVSSLAFVVSAPLMVLSFVATEMSLLGSWRDVGLTMATALLGHLGLGLVFGMAALTVLRKRRISPVPLWLLTLVYLVAANVRLAVLLNFMELWGLPDTTPLWLRVLTSSLLIPLCYGLASYSLESLRRYRATRNRLLQSIIEAGLQLDRQQGAVNSLRDAYLRGVEKEISDAHTHAAEDFDHLRRRIASGFDARPELKSLLERTDSTLRSISHQALANAKIDVPPIRAREFVDTVFLSKPLSITTLSASAAFLFLIVFARGLPALSALTWSVVWWAVVVAVAAASNVAGARGRWWSPPALVSGYTVTLLLGGGMFFVPGLDPQRAWGALSVHLIGVFLAPVVGSGPAIVKSQDAVLQALQKHLDSQTISRLKVESELAVLARKIANRLHAETRGVFLAHVLKLQRCLDDGDLEEALKLVDTIRADLLDTHPEQAGEGRSEKEVLSFLDNWRGLVDIDTNLHTARIPKSLTSALEVLVMNAVNDAVRHGGADWVNVQWEKGEDWYTLTVVNNGQPTPRYTGAGLGDETLTELAGGGWSRTVDVMGFTRLVARFEAPSTKRKPRGAAGS